MAASEQPKVKQIFVNTVTVEEVPTTTVVALLDTNEIVYTGLADESEWHYLPPIPTREEAE